MTASLATQAHRIDHAPSSDFSLDRLRWAGQRSFSAQRVADVQRHMRAFERHTTFGVPDPLHFGGFDQSEIRLGAIWLSRTVIQSPEGYSLEFRPRGEYCLNMPRRGRGSMSSGSHRVDIAAGM